MDRLSQYVQSSTQRVTGETVTSPEMPLQSVELDLEDQSHPRINVNVQFDNKEIKHILFLPSELSLKKLENSQEVWLHIETVNTKTTIRLRPSASSSKRQT
jgi:hypothetical protein